VPRSALVVCCKAVCAAACAILCIALCVSECASCGFELDGFHIPTLTLMLVMYATKVCLQSLGFGELVFSYVCMRERLSQQHDSAVVVCKLSLSALRHMLPYGLCFFCWLQEGRNLLAGHTQQPSEPDCRRPTAPMVCVVCPALIVLLTTREQRV
jgi:hypothetical protein